MSHISSKFVISLKEQPWKSSERSIVKTNTSEREYDGETNTGECEYECEMHTGEHLETP